MLKALGSTLLGLLLLPALGWARCGDLPGDAAAVAAARAAIDATCSCSALPTHGAYVACASGVIAQRVEARLLPASCGGGVKRCAGNSACGEAGKVACCTTGASGKTHCNVKNAAACRAPRGGSACSSTFASCCDACGPGGCATPTPTPTGTPTPSFAFVPCNGGSGAPLCDGTCPAGLTCGGFLDGATAACGCVPAGIELCGAASGFPACGGACFDGKTCQSGKIVLAATGTTIDLCGCVDPAAPCAGSCPASGLGTCPSGRVCEQFGGPGGPECGCLP